MAAELIAFIVKGPVKITKPRRARAVRNAKWAIRQAQDLWKVIAPTYELHYAGLPLEEMPQGRWEPFLEELWESDPKAIERFAKLDPAQFVLDFKTFWDTPCDEDRAGATWRIDPDNRHKKIVFAGCATWGDEPDGDGYKLIRDAFRLGVMDGLEIE